MATARVDLSEEVSFEDKITKVRNEIDSHFCELINCLNERKRNLLNELEDILNSYKRERGKHKQSMKELETGLNFAKENFKSNDLKEFQDSIIKQTTEKQKEFESHLKSQHLILDFDKSILKLASTLGKLTLTKSPSVIPRLPVVDYKGKVTPVLSIGERGGKEEGQFSNPYGVSVHYQTCNIYVGDQSNHRVQVFDKDGKYLFKFGDRDGAGKMNNPLFIAFYQNKIFVTQGLAGCLLVYDLNGSFVRQIGTPGKGEGQFDSPRGIAINESNGDIFVCDYFNNRVQVFSKDFLFKYQSGQGTLKYPNDIKLTNEYIYVLCLSKPLLSSLNFDLTLTHVKNIALDSISTQLTSPRSFFIDSAGNFIISDCGQHYIIVFNVGGDLVHKITDSVHKPIGVTVDIMGRIILVGHNNRLLIF